MRKRGLNLIKRNKNNLGHKHGLNLMRRSKNNLGLKHGLNLKMCKDKGNLLKTIGWI